MHHQWNKILRLLTKHAKDILAKDTDNAFATKSWDNKSWQVSKNTNKIPSLVKSGKMKNSIKWSTKNSIVKATTVKYGKWQNEGDGQSLPARTFIGVSDKSKKEIYREFNRIIEDNMNLLLKDMFKKI